MITKIKKYSRDVIQSVIYFMSGFSHRNPKRIVFGSWFGTKLADNSLYFLDYLVQKKYDENYELVWIGDEKLRQEVLERFDGKVAFCRRNAMSTFRVLLGAKYGFVSNGMSDLGTLVPNKNMSLVQLWHGFPFKRIGADMPTDPNEGNQVFDEFSYFLSTSEVMTKRLLTAFKNYGITENKLIKSGQPRDRIFYDHERSRIIKNELLEKLHIPRGAFVVSYLPTFRDSNSASFSFRNLGSEFEEQLQHANIFIVEKPHHFRAQEYHVSSSANIIEAPDSIDTQHLLIITDLLVTDYSSVYADFLYLNRPIIHYLYDGDYYVNNDRGLYNKNVEATFGGPVIKDEKTLIDFVLNHSDKDFQDVKRNQLNSIVNQYSAQNSGEIIAEKLGLVRG
ncbi:CDP-glycerol glycerophosphotransferase family protein [Lapidilactobacillus mulanensis]|uniref:CDP-glycerol glycerophosphotransferase family protein n=1 Tax=Lapidilactobacillus mulanensis TaxID=2485999 RepID=A0ABW4DPX5_9LACO|nr:CDP-glycerol glycerophosphotransferase family protein [Lapidilactobacillus mulanensis]